MSFRRQSTRLFKRNRRNVVIITFCVILYILVVWSDILEPAQPVANISCYFIQNNDSLSVLHKNLKLPSRSIFFQATSCSGNLTSREYCAIESATRTNPDWQINVVFSSAVSIDTLLQEKFKNIKFWKVHIEEFVKGTSLEGYYKSDVLKKCKWRHILSRHVIKYLILSIWGGIYLDLDMLVARSFGSLVRNWASIDKDDSIAEEVMAFSRDAVGRNVSEISIKEMQTLLRRRLSGCRNQRPTVVTNALRKFCCTADVIYMSSATCNGFEVYGPQFFHPIPETRAREYFLSGETEINNAYTFHHWNHLTSNLRVLRTSPFAKLARRYCPLIFKLYPVEFGF